MASARNDALVDRTVEGSVNYYENHKIKATATEKGLAARLGGHRWNIINNTDRDEIYFRDMRNDDHYLDAKGRHTVHFLNERRRKFVKDERNLVKDGLTMPADHPRTQAGGQHRLEMQLAQMENPQSWRGFQNRCKDSLFPGVPRKEHSINNRRYSNEAEKLRPKAATKEEWRSRRGEVLSHAVSCPSLDLADPCSSLSRAVREDTRKEATQRQTESAHFAPWQTLHTYANSLENTAAGRQHAASQQYCSVNRVENHDFGVARKNNHYSSKDKLTRGDPFYMRPRLAGTNNSVKYDIISNERRWFKY
mmetsp:Transcript_38062/g.104743  ORF Transcript_38062/g.104743 Transcript_38062/m.104743 type:complete len:307 (+) Transcript_38062:77-997(+)